MQDLSVKDALAPSMLNRAEARWGALTSSVTVIGVVGGIASLVSSEPAVMPLGCIGVAAAARACGLRARDSYGPSRRKGCESTVRTTLQHAVGKTPDVEVRAAVHGDPTPEPWDEHETLVRLERRS